VQSLAFNHSGRLLATGDTSRHLRAWFNSRPFFEAEVRTRVDKVRGTDRIRGMAFSPEGRRLYVVCGDTLRAYDLLHRLEMWRYQPRRSFGLLVVSPVAVAVSPAGNVLTAADSGTVCALDPNGRRLARWWDNEAPRHFAFTPDGASIVGVDGFSIGVWDAYSGRKLRRQPSEERIFGMALAPLSGIVAVRTLHTVQLHSLSTLELLDRVPAPTGLPLMSFSPDGSVLALAGREEVLVSAPGDPDAVVLPTTGARVLSLAFHPAGSFLAAGCSDGVIRFWDVFAGPSVK
jgi:WD40 repeat protein